jgi:hypothetical protein
VGPCGSLELFMQTPLPIRARREGDVVQVLHWDCKCKRIEIGSRDSIRYLCS